MRKQSAGLIMYRVRDHALEVLLVHPGGPYYERKDELVWSIPKGEFKEGENPLSTAKREFEEETGFRPAGTFLALSPITQRSGKEVMAWAFEGDCDPEKIKSNAFTMEWPPSSGRTQEFPEVDRAEFFTIPEAKKKIVPAQIPLLEELKEQLEKMN